MSLSIEFGTGPHPAGGAAMVDDRGFCIWLTGLPCSGKSTIASEVASRLRQQGRRVEVLDGDVIRENLSFGLGFSKEDRARNHQKVAFVVQLLVRNGVTVVVAMVSPYRDHRAAVRRWIGSFVEIYVNCPLAECERRDVKGMYSRARAGILAHFTGVDDPYEVPEKPDTELRTDQNSITQCADEVEQTLRKLNLLPPTP
jgi:adenylylsulfate kinase